MEALEDTWRNLQKIIAERDVELNKESQRQEENDRLRREFAKHSNQFHSWLTETRMWLLDGSAMLEGSGSLEAQLEATRRKAAEIRAKKGELKQIEELFLNFAKKASAFNSWFENAEEDLTDPVRCNSIEEIRALKEAHARFQASLSSAQTDFG